jgi:hypothetical protein
MKTPQEAAREYAESYCDKCLSRNNNNCAPGKDKCASRKRNIRNFLAGDAFGYRRGMEKAYRWISVEDELPEPGEPYDEKYYSVKCPLFSESGYAFAEFGRDGCWVEDSTGRDITQYVTHWRPIEPVNK